MVCWSFDASFTGPPTGTDMKIRNIEVTGSSYLFTTKLNPNKGTFPLFKERFKRKLGDKASASTKGTMSASEAGAEAKRILADLDHLQVTNKRDKANQPNTTEEINKAIKTWLWFLDFDPVENARIAEQLTEAGLEARATAAIVHDAVCEQYKTDFGLYTELGNAILKVLRTGQLSTVLSEAVKVWAELADKDDTLAVASAKRYVKLFTDLLGDKQLDQITRKHVATYIEHRVRDVRTTTVAREVAGLSSVWGKAADHFDITTRNPFARPHIKGLGKDSIKRKTPTVTEHATILQRVSDVPILCVIALTGLRLAEAWGLEQADFDEEAGILYVRPNTVRPKLKTAHSERPIPVLPQLVPHLQALFKQKRSNSPNSAGKVAARRLKMALAGMTIHGLRHGFKDRLMEVDGTRLLIEELLGWSAQGMIHHYGTSAITDAKRNLMRKVYANILPTEGGNVIPIRA
jgi:integrase